VLPAASLRRPDRRSARAPLAARVAACAAAAPALLLAAACAGAQEPARVTKAQPPSGGGAAAAPALPRTHAPRPTTAAISVADLMTRIYVFADDSMQGREAGTEGNTRGNAYIERELRRLGLRPAGDGGTFHQTVPLVRRGFDQSAALVAGGDTLRIGVDFVALPQGTPRSVDGAPVIYGGAVGGGAMPTLAAEQIAGRVVVLSAAGMQALGGLNLGAQFPGAAGVVLAMPGDLPAQVRAFGARAQMALDSAAFAAAGTAGAPSPAATAPLVLIASNRAGRAMLGGDPAGLAAGATGRPLSGTVAFGVTRIPATNVVAILPGRDAALRETYVALGAHNDHDGLAARAVDHDSLKAYRDAYRALEIALDPEGDEVFTAEQQAERTRRAREIRVNVDSLRRLRPARPDSVYNGADDDGSGSMALLEIAESLALGSQKPRRSVLFVWHTAEEKGLLGSRWYGDHPTVPRDSIVAQINIDMIGRGGALDVATGGPAYVGIVGSRRLSTALGDLAETVARAQPMPIRLDYALDANGHPQNIYCRSDHANYARHGIPVAFFFTGLHGDYHQLTDEPQYLDYPHYARLTSYIRDFTLRVADLDRRPLVDGVRLAPGAPCRQ
jgi:hypothetical protein